MPGTFQCAIDAAVSPAGGLPTLVALAREVLSLSETDIDVGELVLQTGDAAVTRPVQTSRTPRSLIVAIDLASTASSSDYADLTVSRVDGNGDSQWAQRLRVTTARVGRILVVGMRPSGVTAANRIRQVSFLYDSGTVAAYVRWVMGMD